MATRAAITPTQISRPAAGVAQPAQTTGVVADGHKFKNNGEVFVEVENIDGGSSRTITFQTPGQVAGLLGIADYVVTVALSSIVVVGPFPPGTFNQGNDEVYVDYDNGNESDLKVRVYRLRV